MERLPERRAVAAVLTSRYLLAQGRADSLTGGCDRSSSGWMECVGASESGVPIGQTHQRLATRQLREENLCSVSDTNFPGADYDVPFHVFGICDAPPPFPPLPTPPTDPALICSFAAAGDSSGSVGRR